MQKNIMRMTSLLAALTVAGCGGSKTGNVQPIEEMAFADIEVASTELFEKHGEAFFNSDFTTGEQMPTTGGADYSGYVGIGPAQLATGEEEANAVGQLNVHVEFGESDNQISGTASNFYFTQAEPNYDNSISGSLSLEASIVDSTGQLDGNISGSLTDSEGGTANFNVDIEGGFLGGDAGTVVGAGVGEVTYDESSGLDDGEVGIIFGAE